MAKLFWEKKTNTTVYKNKNNQNLQIKKLSLKPVLSEKNWNKNEINQNEWSDVSLQSRTSNRLNKRAAKYAKSGTSI